MEINHKTSLYWTLFTFEDWKFYIAATSKGLCYVGSQNKPIEELYKWATKRFSGTPLIEDSETLEPYVLEISQYLAGERKTFTVPFDYAGTPFQLAVWKAVCAIPYGQTKSYSDIANDLQKPEAVRAVAAAIGANPNLITTPCHRVVGKNGSLTGYRGGLEMKSKLLNLERQVSFRNGC